MIARLGVLMLLLLLPGAACASDEEIQVYMDEMNPKGLFGLDVHLNYVPRGRPANVDYFGRRRRRAASV